MGEPLPCSNHVDTTYPPIVPPQGDGAAKPKKPKRAGGREPKEAPAWKPEEFAAFWGYYPRGENKQAAIRAWDKLQPSDELIHTMAAGLRRQVRSRSWQEGIGIPYFSTWLNGQRWTDEGERPMPRSDDSSWAPDPEVCR